MLRFGSFGTGWLSFTMAVAVLLGTARADPFPSLQVYSLGARVPDNIQISELDRQSDIIVTARRRAPVSSILAPLTDTARAVWNIGGNPLIGQPDCQPNYTTVGGQPGSPADLGGPVGVHGCFF